jgi:predicted ester cyclase
MGIPPTGKHLTVTATEIFRLVDDKIAEQWVEADYLGLMQQLGVIPATG